MKKTSAKLTLHKLILASAVIGMRPGLTFNDGNLAFPNPPKIRIRHTKGLPGDKSLLDFIK